MENVSLQSLMSALVPPEGPGLAAYLDAVQRALGVSTDAGLARIMGVPASSVANWRRRSVVSVDGARWFTEELPRRLGRRHDFPFEAGSWEVNAVLQLLRDTAVNPFGAKDVWSANQITGEAIPPLLALASVLIAGCLAAELDADDEGRDQRLAAVLRGALPELRRIIAPGLREGAQ